MNLSVASYNVLANACIKPDPHRGVDPQWLESEGRRAALLAKITARDDALLCLQEVEPALFACLEESCSLAVTGASTRPRSRASRTAARSSWLLCSSF